jgi:hypothetical protein
VNGGNDFFDSPSSQPRRGSVSERARNAETHTASQVPVVDIPEQRAPMDTAHVSDQPVSNRLNESRLRGKLVDRLTLMALRHCRHRAELGGTRRAIGSHALGFFYADTDGAGDVAVVAATRLFFDGDEAANLPWVLDTLAQRAAEYPPERLNVGVHLCNRVEEMSSSATLLGVGVTTVSEPPPNMDDSGFTALGMNRPYRGIALMVDGSVLVVRCDGGFLAPVDVRSTHTLNVRGQRIRQWEWMPPEHILAETTDVPAITARLDTLLGLAAGRRPPSPDAVRAVDPVADFVQPGGGHRRRVTGIRLGSIPKR